MKAANPIIQFELLPGGRPVSFAAVKLSVKSDYAARAVLGLAVQHSNGNPVRIETLASAQNIPANYLVQILIDLKAHGIVQSVRGKDGGYRLARLPAEITMGDVLRAVHGQVFDSPALTDSECPVDLQRAWASLRDATQNAADAISFQHLVEQAAARQKMYYI